MLGCVIVRCGLNNEETPKRRCSICKIEKQLDEFGKCKNMRLGRSYRCMSCARTYNNARRELCRAILRGEIVREIKDPNKRRCQICKVEKTLEEFYKDKSSALGRSRRCMPCMTAYNVKIREKYPDMGKKSWYKNHEKNKERLKGYKRSDSLKERDKVRSREWRLANPEKQLSYKPKRKLNKQQYRKDNPDKCRAYDQNRIARKKSVLVLPFERVQVVERDKDICQICHTLIEGEIHLDHWIPLDAGGPHCFENVRCTHPFCNLSKTNKVPPIEELPDYLIGLWEISRALRGMEVLSRDYD
jgi:hypothetical protein